MQNSQKAFFFRKRFGHVKKMYYLCNRFKKRHKVTTNILIKLKKKQL